MAHNEITEEIHFSLSESSRDINSDLILPKRIGLWPLRLAGTMNTDSCASSTFWYVLRDDLIGTCNDVIASMADQGSLSTSTLVFDGTESEENTEK